MSYYCMVHLWKNIGNSLYNQSEHQYDNNTKTTTDTHDYSLLAFFFRLRMVKNKQKPFHHIKIDQVLKFHVMFYSRDRAHPYFYCYQISGTHRVWERTSKRATVSNCTLYSLCLSLAVCIAYQCRGHDLIYFHFWLLSIGKWYITKKYTSCACLLLYFICRECENIDWKIGTR